MVTVVVCSLAVSVGVFLLVRSWEQREVDRRAASVTRDQVEKLQVSMLRSIEVLHSIAGLHGIDDGITRNQFRDFVGPALARQPELKALSWNPRVERADRERFEALAGRDQPGFAIRERSGDTGLRRAEERAEYVPVFFIEPPEPNALALGFDLESDALRRGSLEQAWRTAEPAATEPLHLAQAPGDQSGLLVLRPVFHQGGDLRPPDAGGSNRLAGFAVAVFGIADLVGGTVDTLNATGIRAALWDDSPNPVRMHGDPGLHPGDPGTQQTVLEFAGRRWRVVFAPTAAFVRQGVSRQSIGVLLGGVAFSGLLGAYLTGNWRRTREIARANAALQEEVRVRKRAEAAAAAANAAKSDFLASMSHEIRTPLNAILGYAQLMRQDATFPPEQIDAVNGISTSGRHLLGLINEILDLSKIEAGRMELHPVDFDLQRLVRGLASTFHPLCAQKRIGFRLEPSGSLPVPVRGDEGKLRQVLINLLGNAVKFTQRGEVYLHYHAVGEGRWQFEVIDTGLGIPEDEWPNLFEPFHQGRGAHDEAGTGLGLAIARRQVELLGGRLEFQSAQGIGTRFHFTVPLAEARSAVATQEPELRRLAPGQQVRVLVVDDHESNRRVLEGQLEAIGCQVRTQSGVDPSIPVDPDWRPAMVFLDWLLPGCAGGEAVQRIRSAWPGVRVVVHSASVLPAHEAQARAAGCIDFLVKPIEPAALADCIARHLPVNWVSPAGTPTDPPERPRRNGPVGVPEALLSRLMISAELHSTTALKAALGDLRDLGPDAQALAEEIRRQMRSFDMNGILRTLNESAVVQSSAAGRGSPASHG